MKKEHLKIIKDVVDNLEKVNGSFQTVIDDAITEIDKEIENLGNLADTLQEQHDDMSEKAQEGDKGTELSELIDALGEVKSDLEDIKDELDSEPLGDILNKLGELVTK